MLSLFQYTIYIIDYVHIEICTQNSTKCLTMSKGNCTMYMEVGDSEEYDSINGYYYL